MPRKPAYLSLSENDVSIWISRIQSAEDRVKHYRDDTRDYRDAYAGNFDNPVPDADDREQVFVNRTHRVVQQWVGAMYAQDPKIGLTPPWTEDMENLQNVRKQEAILNTTIRRVGLRITMRHGLPDAFTDGWMVFKQGFHADFDWEAEHLQELTTDPHAENEAFHLGPDAFRDVQALLEENHEDHLDAHSAELTSMKTEVQAIKQQLEGLAQQGVPLDQNLVQAVQLKAAGVMALQEHIDVHNRLARERNRKGLVRYNAQIREESVFNDQVHNSNFIWDEHATRPHNWRWCAERIIRPVNEFKRNTRFPEALREKITANFSMNAFGKARDDTTGGAYATSSAMLKTQSGTDAGGAFTGDEESPDALAAIWKVWDVEHRRVIYIHPEVEKPLLVDEWPHKFLRRAPFVMLAFEFERDEMRPISPVKMFWSQQLELNRYRTLAGRIARRSKRVGIADPDLPPSFVDDVANADSDTIVQAAGTHGKALDEMFHVVDFGQVPQDLYVNAGIADSDIERDTGLSQEQLGGGEGRAKTATAANIRAAAVGVTLDMKLDPIEQAVVEIAENLRSLMRQYYQETRYTEVLSGGVKEMVPWTGDDLQDFQIEAELGSSRKQEKDLERVAWAEAIEIGAQMPGFNLEWAMNQYLMRLGVKDTTVAWKTQGQPGELQQQAAQQAQQLGGAPIGPGQGQNQQQLRPPSPEQATQMQPAMSPV